MNHLYHHDSLQKVKATAIEQENDGGASERLNERGVPRVQGLRSHRYRKSPNVTKEKVNIDPYTTIDAPKTTSGSGTVTGHASGNGNGQATVVN